MTTHTEINVAGVPWPMHKLLAVIVGVVALVMVGVVTASLGPAVLTAAAVATLIWVVGGAGARR